MWCRALSPYRQSEFYDRLVALLMSHKLYEQAFEVLTCYLELRFVIGRQRARLLLRLAIIQELRFGHASLNEDYLEEAANLIGVTERDIMLRNLRSLSNHTSG